MGSKIVKEGVGIKFGLPVLSHQIDAATTAYLTKKNMPSLALKPQKVEGGKQNYQLKNWSSSAAMQANWKQYLLHPANNNNAWLSIVNKVFKRKL